MQFWQTCWINLTKTLKKFAAKYNKKKDLKYWFFKSNKFPQKQNVLWTNTMQSLQPRRNFLSESPKQFGSHLKKINIVAIFLKRSFFFNMSLWVCRMQFWQPSGFFCRNLEESSLSFRKWSIKVADTKQIQFHSVTLYANILVFTTLFKVFCQTFENFSLQVQKRWETKFSKTFCPLKVHLDK